MNCLIIRRTTQEIEGNATPSDVLKGKTFQSTNSETVQTGTLTDYGSEPTAGRIAEYNSGLYLYVPDISSGEQNRGVVQRAIKTDLSNLGDATASDVLSGKTFTSSSGLKVNGTASKNIPILLGTATTFNVKSLVPSVDYTKLTADNFFIQTINNDMTGAHTEQQVYADRSNGNYGVEIQKSYNSSTGVLTCQIHGANWYQDSNGKGANNWNKYCACKVYLIENLS